MARKKKAVAKKAVAKRGPGRPRKTAAVGAKPLAARKAGRPRKAQVSAKDFHGVLVSLSMLATAKSHHAQVIEDLRVRLNDTLYRVEKLEQRIEAGPGLLPVLVTQDSEVAKLSARTLAQVLLSRLVAGEGETAA